MADQRYVSRELTHFVGRALESDEQRHQLLLKILTSGWLTHPPHNPQSVGAVVVNTPGDLCDGALFAPHVVCFCDIPTADLSVHTAKYGAFDISFAKAFLVARGANPVFYVARNARLRQGSVDLGSLSKDPRLRKDVSEYGGQVSWTDH